MTSERNRYEYTQVMQYFHKTLIDDVSYLVEESTYLNFWAQQGWDLVSTVTFPVLTDPCEPGKDSPKICVLHTMKRLMRPNVTNWEYLCIEISAVTSVPHTHFKVNNFDINGGRGLVVEELTLDLLGGDGWEAYSRDDRYVYLKRLKGV